SGYTEFYLNHVFAFRLMNDKMLNDIGKDYAGYLQIDLTKELAPVEETVDDMLTRLEEFESLMEMVRCNGLYSLDGSIPDLLLYKDKLQMLCNQVDSLEAFVNRVKQDIDLVESQMDAAEVDVGNTDGKLKNILRPLFSKISDAPTPRPARSPVYETPQLFKTSNFFHSEGSSSVEK
ncbi:hypothetical protein L9F63_021605, partial [Diploptera punctata]